MQGARQPEIAAHQRHPEGCRQQQDKGGKGETDKGGQRPAQTGTVAANGKAQLAGSWPRQQLAERQLAGKFALLQPAQALDKGALEIPDMGGRAAKTDASQPQKPPKDLAHAAAPVPFMPMERR